MAEESGALTSSNLVVKIKKKFLFANIYTEFLLKFSSWWLDSQPSCPFLFAAAGKTYINIDIIVQIAFTISLIMHKSKFGHAME